MPKTLVSSIRPPPMVRPPPSDRRAKNRLLAPLPVDDIRRFLLDLTTNPVRETQVLQKQGAPMDQETRVIPRPKPSAPLRILIVDPDADTRSLYRAFVQLAGGDVVEASDGRDALVKALMHPPALVMTETRLPIIDGFALCEGLRRDVMTRTVPILVVTGDTGPAVVERARTAGADAILVKPSLDAVLNEIRRLLTAASNICAMPGRWHGTLGKPVRTPAGKSTSSIQHDRTASTATGLAVSIVRPPAEI